MEKEIIQALRYLDACEEATNWLKKSSKSFSEVWSARTVMRVPDEKVTEMLFWATWLLGTEGINWDKVFHTPKQFPRSLYRVWAINSIAFAEDVELLFGIPDPIPVKDPYAGLLGPLHPDEVRARLLYLVEAFPAWVMEEVIIAQGKAKQRYEQAEARDLI